MPGLGTADSEIEATFGIFDAYLDGPADHPVGVAVSGGGDSVALLYALALWGKRPLEVFCVDHGINPSSGRWTTSVATHAEAVGANFTALKWTGEKPQNGLSAAARTARHALLAEAARQKGVRVLCMAHTVDDLYEAQIMAEQGSNVGKPVIWSPSPAWPEGRGIFLFRPFLATGRAALRHFLAGKGLTWIEDPANSDRRSHRARVRQDASPRAMAQFHQSLVLKSLLDPADGSTTWLRDADSLGRLGMIVLDADSFDTAPAFIARRNLAAAVVSAGGGNKLPRSDSVERLHVALAAEAAHTLCGARIQRRGNRIEVVREGGELGRRVLPPMPVLGNAERVWDGRFVIHADVAIVVKSSAEQRAFLSDAERDELQKLPASLRTALPVAENDKQKKVLLANASLTQSPYKGIFCLSWVLYRFLAASGAFVRESAVAQALTGLTGQPAANQ